MLLELIARVETGDGEDRDLDFAIRRAMDDDFHGWHRWALREAALYRDGWTEGCGRKKLGPILLRHRKDEAVALYRRFARDTTPRYTASLDDAIKLFSRIPDLIPATPRKVAAMALREKQRDIETQIETTS